MRSTREIVRQRLDDKFNRTRHIINQTVDSVSIVTLLKEKKTDYIVSKERIFNSLHVIRDTRIERHFIELLLHLSDLISMAYLLLCLFLLVDVNDSVSN